MYYCLGLRFVLKINLSTFKPYFKRLFIWLSPQKELELKKLFNWTEKGYYFTDLGQIPVGGLSLSKFNAVQEPLILSELNRLTNSVAMAKAIGGDLLEEKLADLKIYQLQLQRILRFTLYFLQIKCDGKTLHKIGVIPIDF